MLRAGALFFPYSFFMFWRFLVYFCWVFPSSRALIRRVDVDATLDPMFWTYRDTPSWCFCKSMPSSWLKCLAHRNRSDFCDLRLRCPSRTQKIAAILETRQSPSTVSCTVPTGESLHFRWIPSWEPTKQPPQSSSKGNLFVRVRFGGVPSTVEEVVRVRFCCLLSWRPTRKTQAEQYSDTVLLETRQSNGALRFKGAMENRWRFAILSCDFRTPKPILPAGFLVIWPRQRGNC